MKKWLRLGIILSVIIIALRYLLGFIIVRLFDIQEKGLGSIFTLIYRFPPYHLSTIIISIITGFTIALLISLFSKKKRK
jgi:uncharacterized membrane protein (DUF106 family)